MKKNNIEDFFKDSFENFEAEVSPSVWKNIQTGLKGVGLGVIAKMLLNKIGSNAIIAVVSSAAAVLATVFVMNGTDNKSDTKAPKTKAEPVVVLETPKSSVDEIKKFLSNSAKETPVVKKVTESESVDTKVAGTIKKDKKAIEALLSDERVASISSSCVGGAVPLIINLSNIGNGKINKWTFNDGTKPMTGANPIKYFDEPGIYTITLTSTGADGKTATDSIKVEALANSYIESIPKEFSPNGDGQNDIFIFKSENIAKMQVSIYDKDAQKVYEYKGTGFNWDGKTQKGEKAKEGIYLYMINADGKDGKKYEQKGKINLTR
ncbi:MAG: gliding motility-associated C-terminal domain-containing protein [Bacteroidetes bacterium]|nr:gliding motility-associated C-terminal domain-containing protein [Bacteroidota bacterium]